MKVIDFSEIYKYFQNIISEDNLYLYRKGVLNEDLKIKYYDNSGDYLGDMIKTEYVDDEPEDRTVLVNIMNGGGVQDSSIAIDTYAQVVSFEILALEDQRSDIMSLFTDIAANYKSITTDLIYKSDVYDELGNEVIDYTENHATINVSISDFPKYSEKFDCNGYEKFTTSFTATIIVIPEAKLSNNFKLSINGTDIRYNNLNIARSTELAADLSKNISTKFFPNTTVFSLTVDGLFVDNPELENILYDCSDATKFNTLYTIILKDPSDKIIINKSYYTKDISFSLAYGTIVNWKIQFYEGKVL